MQQLSRRRFCPCRFSLGLVHPTSGAHLIKAFFSLFFSLLRFLSCLQEDGRSTTLLAISKVLFLRVVPLVSFCSSLFTSAHLQFSVCQFPVSRIVCSRFSLPQAVIAGTTVHGGTPAQDNISPAHRWSGIDIDAHILAWIGRQKIGMTDCGVRTVGTD